MLQADLLLFILGQISMKNPNNPEKVPLLVLGHIHQMGIDFADYRVSGIGLCLLIREKNGNRYAQSTGDLVHCIHSGVLQSTLDLSQVGRTDSGLEGQFLLAHVSFVSQFPDTQSERSSNITQYPHLSLILEGIRKSRKSL